MERSLLSRAVQVLLFLVLLFGGLYFAREFLIPVALAGLLAMLLAPLSRRLENRGLNRALAALAGILLLLVVGAGLATLIGWQISNFADQAAEMEQQVMELLSKVRGFITDKLGVSPEEQDRLVRQQQSDGSGQAARLAAGLAGGLMGGLVNLVLVLVYIFLFTYYRGHLKQFALRLVPEREKPNARETIHAAAHVAQQYVAGLGIMIAILWVMYGIGFSIVGVRYALFFAVLCGILEVVPFIGNLTGTGLTVLAVLAQGGDSGMVLGVLITYATVQFLQTYLLEPLVVGAEVEINPVFTILGLVAGELIWGIPGMILAIPLLGIVKIICDHVEPLKPFGFLIGGGPKKKERGGFLKKVKKWFK
jgi:predicted PurR-regulated permease PerM